MGAAAAIFWGAVVIASAIVLAGRYEGHASSDDTFWRLDRFTGGIVLCAALVEGDCVALKRPNYPDALTAAPAPAEKG